LAHATDEGRPIAVTGRLVSSDGRVRADVLSERSGIQRGVGA
jgi:hypothetical protein